MTESLALSHRKKSKGQAPSLILTLSHLLPPSQLFLSWESPLQGRPYSVPLASLFFLSVLLPPYRTPFPPHNTLGPPPGSSFLLPSPQHPPAHHLIPEHHALKP